MFRSARIDTNIDIINSETSYFLFAVPEQIKINEEAKYPGQI